MVHGLRNLDDMPPTPVKAVRIAGTKHFCGKGWVFQNPDSGLEYSPNHPKLSGECPDADSVRRATEMEDILWAAYQAEWKRANARR